MFDKRLIIVGVLLVVIYFLVSGNGIGDIIGGDSKKKVVCEVSVKNPLGFRSKIVSGPTCYVEKCGLLTTTNTLALTDDNDIQLTLTFAGKSSVKTDRIDERKTKTYTMTSKCFDDSVNSGTLRLSDLKGDVETRTIRI